MNTFFTADTHFGHTNIIKHSHRPFTSVEEMDQKIIDNWNCFVNENDEVWHLGDFNFRSIVKTDHYLKQLNGRINIIWGNHDDEFAKKYRHLFYSFQDVKYLKLSGEKITLNHYAQRVWRNSGHGSWHLFGHSHGDLPNIGKSMDVGVDCYSYCPMHFDEVKAYMDKQEVTHHHFDHDNN